MQQEKFAIRFGLGAIKAVGFAAMESAIKAREIAGKFKDVYDFAERLDPKSINKKSIEALAKSGAFESFQKNRRQIAESFDIISSYAVEKNKEANSNQMSLFGGLPEANAKPELKKITDWGKIERLQKEFEAFGFFLNEHPLDDNLSELKKRGVIFSDKLERDELEDGHLVKMAGVVAASKHRSGARGRFAYLTISDPFGIFEAMIFDEALINSARDILADSSVIALECLIRKDDGGVRILVREVKRLENFIQNTPAQDQDFEDIKKQISRNYGRNFEKRNQPGEFGNIEPAKITEPKKILKKTFSKVEITIKTRDPILAVKSLLSQRFAPLTSEKFSKVFFAVVKGNKLIKVELTQKYFLDEADISNLRRIEKIIDVQAIL